jgi:hypothetical protein
MFSWLKERAGFVLVTTNWQEVLSPWPRWPARCDAHYGITFRTAPSDKELGTGLLSTGVSGTMTNC